MESVLFFRNFLKIKKKAWDTLNAPQPANEKFQFFEILKIFIYASQNLHWLVWVYCGHLWVYKPFFWKSVKYPKVLEHFPYLDRFHTTSRKKVGVFFYHEIYTFWAPTIGVPWYKKCTFCWGRDTPTVSSLEIVLKRFQWDSFAV